MADMETILEENGELLLDRIRELKSLTPGSEEEKNVAEIYEKIFKQQIELTKISETVVRDDNEDYIARERIKLEREVEQEKLKFERERIDIEAEMTKKSEKTKTVQAWGTIAAAILVPVGVEVLKQGMHWAVTSKVLTFERTGIVTSCIGKAEFRK